MSIANTLSRAYLADCEHSVTEVKVECIHAIPFLPIPDHQLQELQREMAYDSTLHTVKKTILDSFPDTKDLLPAATHQYFDI